MAESCPALTTPQTLWSFCPSLPAASLFTALFLLTTLTHLTQAIYYKKPYCTILVLSGTLQTINFIFRVLSIQNPASLADYAVWFVLILVAPLFTNAGVYMVMARMIWNFTRDSNVFGVKAWWFGTLFVVWDVCALIVQIIGAVIATGNHETRTQVLRGLHIYMGGVGFQQFLILVFLVFAIGFHRKIQTYHPPPKRYREAITILCVVYAVLILISLRIVFRIREYSQGLTSTIPNHEAYEYGLDSLPMLFALCILNVWHPGRLMPGKEGDIPTKKMRRGGCVSNSLMELSATDRATDSV